MKLYQIQVTKTKAYRTAPAKIPRGITGAVLELRFSEEWEGLNKTVVFRAGDITKDVLNVENSVVIPSECTRESGVLLEVGVYGTDGENTVAIPTLWAAVGTVYDATDPSGDETTNPALPVWAQLQAEIDQLEEQGVRDKSIDEAVEDYLEKNPIVPEDLGVAPAELGLRKAEGTQITVDDSGALPLHSLKLFGKTTQNGTPTPDSPAELVSVGDSGSIGAMLAGKNLLDTENLVPSGVAGVTWGKVDHGVKFSGTATANGNLYQYQSGYLPAGKYTLSVRLDGTVTGSGGINISLSGFGSIWKTGTLSGVYSATFEVTKLTELKIVQIVVDKGATYDITVSEIQLEPGSIPTTYEPYKGQTLTAATPNGLPGIPVASGVCDEIDFARGVYVQRVPSVTLSELSYTADSAQGLFHALLPHPAISTGYDEALAPHLMCNTLPAITRRACTSGTQGVTLSGAYIYVCVPGCSTTDQLQAWFASHPTQVIYRAATPTETALPEEELAQYAALRTNEPNSILYNDAGAHMEMEYYTPISALPVAGGAMGGQLSMAGNRITDLGTPIRSGDALPLGYAQSLFAPAGYGLGEPAVSIFSWNSALKTGFYRSNGDAPDAYWWWGYVVAYSEEAVVQHIYRNGTHGILSAHRNGGSSGFGEWEWDNPPMERGVEYRTTERYNGVAVYKKLVNCGYLPNNGMKQITFSEVGTVQAHKVYGKAGTMTLPYLTNARIGVTKNRIVITTDSDYSDRYGAVIVEYTKP